MYGLIDYYDDNHHMLRDLMARSLARSLDRPADWPADCHRDLTVYDRLAGFGWNVLYIFVYVLL